jgi:hypothetical protein
VRPGRSFKDIYITPAAFQNGVEEVLIVIEGVHQAIPEHKVEVAGEVKILPPPPADANAPTTATEDLKTGLQTEADRLKDRYKKIGEIENHKFGEGLPGSKPPDFTIDPDKAAKPPATPPPQTSTAAGTQAPAGGVGPQTQNAAKPPASTATAPAKPAPVPGSTPATAQSKPAATSAVPQTQQPAAKPPASLTPGAAAAPTTKAVKPPAPKPRPTPSGLMTDDGRPKAPPNP